MSILGHHSAGELRDWLAAIDYQMTEIDKAYASMAASWKARDATSFAEWTREWGELKARYAHARDGAKTALLKASLTPVPDAVVPVEDEWQSVLRALVRSPDGARSRGDFQDLYDRFVSAVGTGVDLSRTPQPTATDVDLGAYRAADAVIHTGEDLAKRAAPAATGTALLVGGGLLLGLGLFVRSVMR